MGAHITLAPGACKADVASRIRKRAHQNREPGCLRHVNEPGVSLARHSTKKESPDSTRRCSGNAVVDLGSEGAFKAILDAGVWRVNESRHRENGEGPVGS